MGQRHKVILVQPSAGIIKPRSANSMLACTDNKHDVRPVWSEFGNVSHNFNLLWCNALNARESKDFSPTHFAMLHSDIEVSTYWLDVLLDEMDRLDAEVMTTTMAIKDLRGLTTTGIRYPGVWGTRRFTMQEIMKFPETIGIDDVGDPRTDILAINTGCWVARINTGWADKFPGFTDKYKIAVEGGRFMAWFDSEDWLFSDWLASQGVRYYSTRKVRSVHIGGMDYPNDNPWGQQMTDFQCPSKPLTDELRRLPPPNIRIETEKPVAIDSLDHTQPLGTVQDNSRNPKFNAKLCELIAADQIRLLDFGCAGGGLVRSILEAGGYAVGIEGSDINRKAGRAEWSIIPDWLFTADARQPFQLLNGEPLKFNVITAWEFLEHIEEEALEAVIENIKRHAEPDALFIGSISFGTEPHHRIARRKSWWEARLAEAGIRHDPGLEEHFGDDLVRGSTNPASTSFPFMGRLQETGIFVP